MRKLIFLIPSILLWSGMLFSQTTIVSVPFDEPNGSTSGENWRVGQVNDCDDIPYEFSVEDGKFKVSEAEGSICCGCVPSAPVDHCGNNDNSIVFGPFDVTGYCELSFEISISPVGPLDCPFPLSSPICSEGTGTDQVILSFSIDGGNESFLPLYCGSAKIFSLENFNLPLTNNSSFEFTIYAGTQTNDEFYFINSVKLKGEKGATNLEIQGPTGQTCEGEEVNLTSSVSNCNDCSYSWRDEDGMELGTEANLTIAAIEKDEDEVRVFELQADNGECIVSKYIGFAVVEAYEDIPIDQDLCNTDQLTLIDIVSLFATEGSASGPGIQPDEKTFRPFGLPVGLHTITYTPTNSCGSSEVFINVVGNEYSISSPGTFCEEDESYPLETEPDGVAGNWFGTGVTNNAFDPAVAGLGEHELVFKPTSLICPDDSSTIVVSVLAQLNAGKDTLINICNTGMETTVSLIDLVENADEIGEFEEVEDFAVDYSNPDEVSFLGVDAACYEYYHILNEGSCSPDTAIITIMVDRPEFAGQDTSVILCNVGEMSDPILDFATLLPSAERLDTIYTLTGSGMVVGSDYTFDFTGFESGAYQFIHEIRNGTPCGSSTARIDVELLGKAFAGRDTMQIIRCNSGYETNRTVNFLELLPGVSSLDTIIDFSASGVSLVDLTELDFLGIAAGTYNFLHIKRASVEACDADTALVTISIQDLPYAGRDTLMTACNGGNTSSVIDFEKLMPDIPKLGRVVDVDESGVSLESLSHVDFSGIDPGEYRFYHILENSSACADTAIVELVLLRQPNAGIISSAPFLCEGHPEPFNLMELLEDDPELGGVWTDYGAGLDLSDPTNVDLSQVTGNIDLTYTVSNGICVDPADVVIVIKKKNDAGRDTMFQLCNTGIQTTVDFTSLSNLPSPIDSLVQFSGDEVNLDDVTEVDFSGTSPGAYSFYHIVDENMVCDPDTALVSIMVLAPPDAGPDMLNIPVCEMEAINLSSHIEGDDGGQFYDIVFNPLDGSIINIGNAPGNSIYHYVLEGDDVCSGDTATISFNIQHRPQAVLSGIPEICDSKCREYQVTLTGSGTISFVIEMDYGGNNPLLLPKSTENEIFDLVVCNSGSDFNVSEDSIFINRILSDEWDLKIKDVRDQLCTSNSSELADSIQISLLDTEIAIKNYTICKGDSITFGGSVFNESHTFDVVRIPGLECDTSVTVSIDFYDEPRGLYEDILCAGDSLTLHGQVFHKDFSTTEIILIGEGQHGCDSILEVNLDIIEPVVREERILLCEGDSIFIAGAFRKTAGLYIDSLQAANGCDSLIFYELELIPSPDAGPDVLGINACRGEVISLDQFVEDHPGGNFFNSSFELLGSSTITIGIGPDSLDFYYILIGEEPCSADTATISIYIPADPTAVILGSPEICDAKCKGFQVSLSGSAPFSFDLHLRNEENNLLTIPKIVEVDVYHFTVCHSGSEIKESGDSLFINNTENNIWTLAITGLTDQKCSLGSLDTADVKSIELSNPISVPETIHICPGDSIDFKGIVFSEDHLLDTIRLSGLECDTLLMVEVEVYEESRGGFEDVLCAGDSLTLHGQVFHKDYSSAEIILIGEGQHGCDSILEVNLDIIEPVVREEIFELCEGDSIFIAGAFRNTAGLYIDSLQAANGCDSLIFYELELIPPPDAGPDVLGINACRGEEINLDQFVQDHPGGNFFNTSFELLGSSTITIGIGPDSLDFYYILTGEEPCSADTATISIYIPADPTAVILGSPEICDAKCKGFQVSLSGSAPFSFDLHLRNEENNLLTIPKIVEVDVYHFTVCHSGSEIKESGDSLFINNTESDHWTLSIMGLADQNCSLGSLDTADVKSIELNNPVLVPETIHICPGESKDFKGIVFSEDHLLDTIRLSGIECDTLLTVEVEVYEESRGSFEDVLCAGDSLTLHGQVFHKDYRTAEIILIGEGQHGCDSILEVNLDIIEPVVREERVELCEGDSIFLAGSFRSTAGLYIDSLQAINGCDSLIFYELELIPSPDAGPDVLGINACRGEVISLDQFVEDHPGGNFFNSSFELLGSSTITIGIGPDSLDFYYILIGEEPCSADTATISIYNPADPTAVILGSPEICDAKCKGFQVSLSGSAPFSFDLHLRNEENNLLTIPKIVEVDVYHFTVCHSGSEIKESGDSLFINNTENNIWTLAITGLTDQKCSLGSLDTADVKSIELSNPVTVPETIYICPGDSIDFKGIVFSEDHLLDTIRSSGLECDTLLMVEVEVYEESRGSFEDFLCAGDSLSLHGQVFHDEYLEGTVFLPGLGQNGCDSLLDVKLALVETKKTVDTLKICMGDSILIAGIFRNTDGIYTDSLQAESGCDSLIQHHLINVPFPYTGEIADTVYTCETVAGSIDLFSLFADAPDNTNGIWREITNGNLNLDNPNMAIWLGEPDTSLLEYSLTNESCTSVISMHLIRESRSFPGTNRVLSFCEGDQIVINLNDLKGESDEGTWQVVQPVGLVLDDPNHLDLSGKLAGIYHFQYTTNAGISCSAESSSVFVNINQLPSLELIEQVCSRDLKSYQIEFVLGEHVKLSTTGTEFFDGVSGHYFIQEIPVGQNITINLIDTLSQCISTIDINSPECPCPIVQTPVLEQDTFYYCRGDQLPFLEVESQEGLAIDWYAEVSGDHLLVANSQLLFPEEAGTYFVEYRDSINGCTSLARVAFHVIESDPPQSQEDVPITICKNDVFFPGDLLALSEKGRLEDPGNTGALQHDSIFTSQLDIGSYPFLYIEPSLNICSDDTTNILLIVEEQLEAGSDQLIQTCAESILDLKDYIDGDENGRFYDHLFSELSNTVHSFSGGNSQSTFYYIVGEETVCGPDTSVLEFIIHDFPSGELTGPTTICSGKCEEYQIHFLGDTPLSFTIEWEDVSGNSSRFEKEIDTGVYVFTLCYDQSDSDQGDTLFINADTGGEAILSLFNISNSICPVIPGLISDSLSIQLQDAVLREYKDILCPGDSLFIGNEYFHHDRKTGNVRIPGEECDTIVEVELSFYEENRYIFEEILCEGDSIMIGEELFDADNLQGIVVLEAQSITGCDSMVDVQLSLVPNQLTDRVVKICEGDSVLINGAFQFAGGNYSESFESFQGCDSTVNTMLVVLNYPEIHFVSDTIKICVNEAENLNLFSFLSQDMDLSGIWFDYEFSEEPIAFPASYEWISQSDTLTLSYALTNGNCYAEKNLVLIKINTPNAGEDMFLEFCEGDALSINLNEIIGEHDSGTWMVVDGSGIQIDQSNQVDISQLTPGEYTLHHVVMDEFQICASDMAVVGIYIAEIPEFEVIEKMCSPDLHTYSVDVLTSSNILIHVSEGEIEELDNNFFRINGIRNGVGLSVEFLDTISRCALTALIDPAECVCQVINEPQVTGQGSIHRYCEGDPIPNISVEVRGQHTTAVWYDSAIGGVRIADRTLSYQAQSPGIFYVESLDTINGCTSNTRTEISLVMYETHQLSRDTILCIGDSILIGEIWRKEAGVYTENLLNMFQCDSMMVTTLDFMDCSAQFTVNESDVSCLGDSTGSIEIMVSGEFPPYRLSWENDNGTISGDENIQTESVQFALENLPEGEYEIRLTDRFGNRIQTENKTIRSLSELRGEIIIGGISCPLANEGSMQLILAGGVEPYQIKWSNGATGIVNSGLASGQYSVEISDAAGCAISLQDSLPEPSPPEVEILLNNAFCPEFLNGSIEVQIQQGSNPPYKYSMNGFSYDTLAFFTGLDVGNYDVFVKDDKGCVYTYEENIIDFEYNLQILIADDYAINKGDSIRLTPEFNFTPERIEWMPPIRVSCTNCLDPIIYPDKESDYLITAFDEFGCSASRLIHVRFDETSGIYIPNIIDISSENNHLFYPMAREDLRGDLEMRIFDRWGNQVYNVRGARLNDVNAAWNTQFKGEVLRMGVYVYFIRINLDNGKILEFSGDITLIR